MCLAPFKIEETLLIITPDDHEYGLPIMNTDYLPMHIYHFYEIDGNDPDRFTTFEIDDEVARKISERYQQMLE